MDTSYRLHVLAGSVQQEPPHDEMAGSVSFDADRGASGPSGEAGGAASIKLQVFPRGRICFRRSAKFYFPPRRKSENGAS